MSKTKVNNNQSIWNLAMQHGGDVRAMLQWFEDGTFSGFDDVPVPGSEIPLPVPVKRAVKEYYDEEIAAGRMIAVATALDADINSPSSPWSSGFSPGFGSGSAYTNGFSSGFY